MEAGKLGIDFPINYPKGGLPFVFESKNPRIEIAEISEDNKIWSFCGGTTGKRVRHNFR